MVSGRTNSPLAHSRLPLVGLYTANAISITGNVMANIAIPWFVLETTGSAAKMGVVGFFHILPTILAGIFGGVLIDRTGYRRMSVLSDVASGVCTALIPLLYSTIGLSFELLVVLVFLGALLDAPGGTARNVLAPTLAEQAGVRLEVANSIGDGVSRFARLAGAPLAGVLVGILGPQQVLWIDAASFAISAGLVALLVPSIAVAKSETEKDSSRHYGREILEGLRFLARDRLLASIMGAIMVTNLIDGSLFSVILPVYLKAQFGSAVPMGLMVSFLGGAALLGTMLYAAGGHRLPRTLILSGGFTLASLRYFTLAAYPGLPLLLVASALAGLGVGPINPLTTTIQYERVPPQIRARVFGAISAGVMLATPLGVLFSGYLLEWLGMSVTLLLCGALYLAASASLAIKRELTFFQ